MGGGTKYYIYGGGRWREVDASSGRVDGWGRARFLVARRGKLAAARSGAVLAALRALAESKPSAARDGPQLPYKFPKDKRVHTDVKENGPQSSYKHCHCCNNNGSSTNSKTCVPIKNNKTMASQCKKVDTGIQTTLPFRDASSSKRKRDSTSSERLSPTRITTVATVHRTEHKGQNSLSLEWKKSEPKRLKNSVNSVTNSKRVHNSSSFEESQTLSTLKRSPKKLGLNLHKSRTLKRDRDSSKESSPTLRPTKRVRSDKLNNISKYLKPKSRVGKEPSDKYSLTRKKVNNYIHILSESNSESHASKQKEGIKRKPNVSLVISSETESKSVTDTEYSRQQPKPLSKKTSHQKPTAKNKSSSKNSRRKLDNGKVRPVEREIFRELIIEERDVEILRIYIQKHHSDEELLRFDTDDNYKMMHFYRINPLVSIERCPRIARMLRSVSQDTQITIEDFASKLGLRSLSETSQPKRYRMRKRDDRSIVDTQSSDSEDKENFDSSKSRHLRSDKVLREPLNRQVRRREKRLSSNEVVRELNHKAPSKERSMRTEIERQINNKKSPVKERIRDINGKDSSKEGTRERKKANRDRITKETDNAMNTVELSTDSEREHFVAQKPVVKKPVWKKPKVTSSKRRSLKEYSNLEDHAIVSWVSTGGRASCVNGNRLWRELQEQYAGLTGHGRSWHSLRNRYLRYILPRLGALALPPAHQARLRAAAATGELKKRKLASRRNSIFALPPRGAASRPRARAPTPTPAPAPTPAPSAQTQPRVEDKQAKETRHNRGPTAPPPPRPAPPRAPSPRYSDVTRQFADTHRHSSETSVSQHSAHTHQRTNRRNGHEKPGTPYNEPRKSRGRSLSDHLSPGDSESSYTNTSGSDSGSRSPKISLRKSTRLSGQSLNRGKRSPSDNGISTRLKESVRRSMNDSLRNRSDQVNRSTRRSLRHKSPDLSSKSVDSGTKSPVLENHRRSLIGSMRRKTPDETALKNQRTVWSRNPSPETKSDMKERPRTRKLFNPNAVM